VNHARVIRPFTTLDDYFEAVRTLAGDLEAAGLTDVATEVREGFGCLNGLTDGWAMFLEGLDRAGQRGRGRLSRVQRARLREVRAVAFRFTYRR
jgi:hypothetical protein